MVWVGGGGVGAARRGCQNVAKSFHLDVCPHCNNWFVFVLSREYTNMASGLERHASVWLTKHCSIHQALHRSLRLCLSLQPPSGCAHLTGRDATLHHMLLLISPTRFSPMDSSGPSLLTCVLWTSSVQTRVNFILNSSRDPKVSKDSKCVRLNYREMCIKWLTRHLEFRI